MVITIMRCAGAQSNDGNELGPFDDGYDPSALPGATEVATGVLASDETYDDTGLTSGTYTYWAARTAL